MKYWHTRLIMIFLIFGFSSVFVCGQKLKGIHARYDQFKNETVTSADELTVVDSNGILIKLIPSYTVAGPKSSRPDSVSLLFISIADDWLFNEPGEPIALIGNKTDIDQRLGLGQSSRLTSKLIPSSGRYGKIKTREVIMTRVPLDSFLQLANAERVQMRLRPGLEFELKSRQLQTLRNLAMTIPQQ